MLIQMIVKIVEQEECFVKEFYSRIFFLNSLEEFTPKLFNGEFLKIFQRIIEYCNYKFVPSGIENFHFNRIPPSHTWTSTPFKVLSTTEKRPYLEEITALCEITPKVLPISNSQIEQFLTSENTIIRELAKQLKEEYSSFTPDQKTIAPPQRRSGKKKKA